jgi:hypothetical protein
MPRTYEERTIHGIRTVLARHGYTLQSVRGDGYDVLKSEKLVPCGSRSTNCASGWLRTLPNQRGAQPHCAKPPNVAKSLVASGAERVPNHAWAGRRA